MISQQFRGPHDLRGLVVLLMLHEELRALRQDRRITSYVGDTRPKHIKRP